MRSLLLGFMVFFLAAVFPSLGTDSHAALLRALNTDVSDLRRIEALKQLEKSGPLEAAQILRSITDTSPVIRAAMVRLGAPLCSADSELALRLLALANDRAPEVQREMLLMLPTFPHPEARNIYRKLLQSARKSVHPDVRAFAQKLSD